MVVAQEGKNTGFVLQQGDSRATYGGKRWQCHHYQKLCRLRKVPSFCCELQPVRTHSSKSSAASGRREFPLYSVKTDEFIVPPGLLEAGGCCAGSLSHRRVNPPSKAVTPSSVPSTAPGAPGICSPRSAKELRAGCGGNSNGRAAGTGCSSLQRSIPSPQHTDVRLGAKSSSEKGRCSLLSHMEIQDTPGQPPVPALPDHCR